MERLEAAGSIEGFWPALHSERIVKRRVLPTSPPPLLDWPLFDSPVAGTTRLQITAGCPGYCSFCFEGWDRRPYRELPMIQVLEAARQMRARNGVDTLEVYSFNFNTHEDIVPLLYELGRIFKNVNLMSQRLDILARSEGLMAAELAADKRSFTLGIEGISARMRAYYRKGILEEDLAKILSLVVAPGVRELKLFYILSGFESDDDVAEFARFAESLNALRAEKAPGLRVLVSVGYLVRLPGTPLRHAPLVLDEDRFRPLTRKLEAICETHDLEWRLAVNFDEYRADQLISLAGPVLLSWLESLADLDRDSVYDEKLGRKVWKSLEAFSTKAGFITETFLGEKDQLGAAKLPMLAESGKALWSEYLEARAFIDRESCLGESCSDCGACEAPAPRLFMIRHREARATRAEVDRLARLLSAKRDFSRILIKAERPFGLAGASAPTQEAWLLSRLSSVSEGAWQRIFSASLLFPRPEGDFGFPEGAFGYAVFGIDGPSIAGLEELARARGFEILSALPKPQSLSIRFTVPTEIGKSIVAMAKTPAGDRGGIHHFGLVADWLRLSHLAFIETVEGSGRRYAISQKDRGRRIAYAVWADEACLNLELGPKAKLMGLTAPLGPRVAALFNPQLLSWN